MKTLVHKLNIVFALFVAVLLFGCSSGEEEKFAFKNRTAESSEKAGRIGVPHNINAESNRKTGAGRQNSRDLGASRLDASQESPDAGRAKDADAEQRDSGSAQDFGSVRDGNSDGNSRSARDAGATRDSGSVSRDAAEPRDSGQATANIPDAGTNGERAVFELAPFGTLVEAAPDTAVWTTERPTWSSQALTAAIFERNGKNYTLLVYEKDPWESFSQWRASAEVGDAFLSEQTVETADGHTGYVYETNDFGASPVSHITIPTAEFVYYFETDTNGFGVPEDFTNFIGTLSLR